MLGEEIIIDRISSAYIWHTTNNTAASAIKKYKPDFEMVYDVDPLKQSIAESWPDRLDDTCAREEWDWCPRYDLDAMTRDMLEKLAIKLGV